jgi:ketosteroid isomerase-like protein
MPSAYPFLKSPEESNVASTEDILNHHLECFDKGDLDGLLSDYTEVSVLELPHTQLRGLEKLRKAFTAMFEEFGKGTSSFEMKRTSIHGDHAYLFWKAQTEDNDYHIGTDTFHIQDGKILYQTFSAHITPRV